MKFLHKSKHQLRNSVHPKDIDDKQDKSVVREVETGAEDEEEDEVDAEMTSVCMHQRVAEVPPCLFFLAPLKMELSRFTVDLFHSHIKLKHGLQFKMGLHHVDE